MIKKIIPVLLILLQAITLENASGQNQANLMDYISNRFLSYCESVPREEIYVHTDREEYISGEDLWLNIYLFDRKSFHPGSDSKIAYLELLNAQNRPVVQKRFRIEHGIGPGQFVIPDSLSTGTYTLRAYTNWMKNFLPYNCFMKEIRVYNAVSSKAFKESVQRIDNSGGTETGSASLNTGLSLKVNNFKSDTLEIFINADQKFRSENNNLCYLFIQTHGNICHDSPEKIEEVNTQINIPKKTLVPGINQITIFDSKGKPVCERFIFIPPVKANQFIKLHSTDSCGKRSRISIEFDFENMLQPSSGSANLSVAVAPVTKSVRPLELTDYLTFGTEFGLSPSILFNGRKIDQVPPEEIDSLLLTVKSNWINWKTILSDDLPSFKYPVEKEDHFISGTLLTSDQQLAHPGEFLLLSTPGKTPVFQYGRTDYKAEFRFNVHIDEEIKDLIIQPDDTTRNRKILIESSFSDQYLKPLILADSTGKPLPSYISKWSVNYQVNKIYESAYMGDRLTPVDQPVKPKRFYGKPEVEIVMKDYIKLPVMEEVFFELIPRVTLKNDKSAYEISILDPMGKRIYEDPPVLMIDGVIIKDPAIIASLDPEVVEKIDAIREKYVVGDFLFYGIVNAITKAGDFSYVSLPDYVMRMKYRVIEPVRAFMAPDYSTAEMKTIRTPDFRNTLYWNPSVKPDMAGKAKIEFWTSDINSDYEINIQGITKEGKSVSLRKIIKVK